MSTILPAAIASDAYDRLHADPSRWRAAIVAVADRHRLGAGEVRALGGSNLVASIGARVIKVFPPFLRFQWESERVALEALAGRLPVAIPELFHEGEIDGWPYLVLGEVDGVELASRWADLAEAERRMVLAQLGELVAFVQSLPVGRVADLAPRWDAFLDRQLAGCVARHRRFGAPAALVDDIPAFLERTAPALPRPTRPVILTGEYTPTNVLVARAGAPRVVGLIDFGDAMAGAGDYDLLGPATFLAAGDAARLDALLSGYGACERAPALRDRLMALLLLHRYANFDVQVRVDGWRDRATSVDALAALIFPFG